MLFIIYKVKERNIKKGTSILPKYEISMKYRFGVNDMGCRNRLERLIMKFKNYA